MAVLSRENRNQMIMNRSLYQNSGLRSNQQKNEFNFWQSFNNDRYNFIKKEVMWHVKNRNIWWIVLRLLLYRDE